MIPPLYTRVDAHKSKARLYYQLKFPWCLLRIWLTEGSWEPIYSRGAQHWWLSTALVMRRSYQDTVGTWMARSLSATGSSWTSAAVLMTPFQTLSSSGGGSISIQGQTLYLHSTPVGQQVTTTWVTRCFCVEIPVVLSVSKWRASVSSTKGRRS
jgi:hypothetical protein